MIQAPHEAPSNAVDFDITHRPLAHRRQIIASRHGRRAWDFIFTCDVHNGHGTPDFETFAFECVEHGVATSTPGATALYLPADSS